MIKKVIKNLGCKLGLLKPGGIRIFNPENKDEVIQLFLADKNIAKGFSRVFERVGFDGIKNILIQGVIDELKSPPKATPQQATRYP